MRAPTAHVLDALRASPEPITVAELAARLGMTAHFALRAVRSLEARGLASRREARAKGGAVLWSARSVARAGTCWGIWDVSTGRAYVNRTWPTQEEAHAERQELLAPYPDGHEWRRRLIVRAVGGGQ